MRGLIREVFVDGVPQFMRDGVGREAGQRGLGSSNFATDVRKDWPCSSWTWSARSRFVGSETWTAHHRKTAARAFADATAPHIGGMRRAVGSNVGTTIHERPQATPWCAHGCPSQRLAGMPAGIRGTRWLRVGSNSRAVSRGFEATGPTRSRRPGPVEKSGPGRRTFRKTTACASRVARMDLQPLRS